MASATETPSQKARRKGPPTYDRLAKKQARTKTVEIPLDDELAERVARLVKDVEKRKLYLAKVRSAGGEDADAGTRLAELEAELTAARQELEDESVTLVLRAIGRKRYEELLLEFPPTDEQKAKAKEDGAPKPDFDPESEFPVKLVAASCVEPDLTLEETREIWDAWNQGELTSLFMAAFEVNTQRRMSLGEG